MKKLALFVRLSPPHADLYVDMKNGWAEMSVKAWSLHGYDLLLKGFCRGLATPTALDLSSPKSFATRIKPVAVSCPDSSGQLFIVGRRNGEGTAFMDASRATG